MKSSTSIAIAEFCETGSGTTPSRQRSDEYFGGTIPWVKSRELRETEITHTEECVTERAIAETSLKRVPPGALLVAMYGATVGRVGILGIEATTNQAVCYIVPDPKRADNRYLFHALQFKASELVARGVGGAQPNITQGIVKDTKIFLPALDDQRRIAAILDAADALRTKCQATLANLVSLAQSIFIEMFGDPVQNQIRIKTLPLGEIATFENGDRSENYPSGDDIKNEGILFLSTRNIVNDVLDLSSRQYISAEKYQSLSRGKARRGDLIITLRGTLAACRT